MRWLRRGITLLAVSGSKGNQPDAVFLQQVEIIVEESGSSLPDKPAFIGLRVELRETELQRRVRQAGGKWNSPKRVWEIHYDQAVALGLKKRIVKQEVLI